MVQAFCRGGFVVLPNGWLRKTLWLLKGFVPKDADILVSHGYSHNYGDSVELLEPE